MARPERPGVVHDPTQRFYRVPDEIAEAHRLTSPVWLPAVSTILDVYQAPSLRTWYGKVGLDEAERIKFATAQIGTDAHGIIERIINGEKVLAPEWNALDKRIQQCVRAWLRWYQVVKFKPLQSEQAVYSLKYGYAGTLDAIGYVKQDFCLADWKTSDSFFFPRTNLLQLGAYYQAYLEMHPDRPRFKTIRCVVLGRSSGDYKEHTMTPKQARVAFQHFVYARRVWEYVKKEYDEKERDTSLKTA